MIYLSISKKYQFDCYLNLKKKLFYKLCRQPNCIDTPYDSITAYLSLGYSASLEGKYMILVHVLKLFQLIAFHSIFTRLN